MASPTPIDTERSSPSASTWPRWRLPGFQEFGLLVVLLVMAVALSIYGYYDASPGQENTFLNVHNLLDQVATPMSYYAIMAVGVTFVIITGGIDISVGSIMAVAGLGTAAVLQRLDPHARAWEVVPIAIAVPLAIGLICGLFNGVIITSLRLHPFIVTLGTLSIIRGIAIVSPPAQTLPEAGRDLPHAFTNGLMRWKLAGLEPVPMLITVACVIVGWIYLSYIVGGREIYAVGGNEEAARFSGLRVNWIKLRAYGISGLCAGIAGMVSLGHFGTASSTTGSGFELMVVAAAVVGGASLSGGRGTTLGALLGALIISMIEDGIITLHRPQEYRLIIIGSAIILAAALDKLSDLLRQRRLAGEKKI